MPDTTVLTPVERRRAADRLWKIVTMIDKGASPSAIREAVTLTAFAMENPTWDGRESKDRPMNMGAS
jgi:hypothetical protein